MCRWIAYQGPSIYLEDVVTKPCRSLVHQSMHASEAKTGTNGDGFGVGWYGDRGAPGLYREVRPAWSDENLLSICQQVRSPLFFAHVRASTGTATTRANCHPFAHQGLLFMHNGQVGCYGKLKRRIENLIPDAFYQLRVGTTDSEALFLIALAHGVARDPVGGMARTLAELTHMMSESGVCEPLRFTAALTDGKTLTAYRWASDGKAPTLYWRQREGQLVVVSEPIDDAAEHWNLVPQGHVLQARAGESARLRRFEVDLAMAAA